MTRPYLAVDQRLDYLLERGYLATSAADSTSRTRLAHLNFHYFLGYARNFRKLRRDGFVAVDASLADLLRLVRIDHEVAVHIFSALRAVEWRLRQAFIDEFCGRFTSPSSYLNVSTFKACSQDSDPLAGLLKAALLRSREPYVLGLIRDHADEHGLDQRGFHESWPVHEVEACCAKVPVWAVVDGWSFGLLRRAILETAEGGAKPLWRAVAEDLSISGSIFETQLRGVATLRNTIAHHQRLWMRPTADTPKLPKIYRRRAQGADPKSMYVAALALASMMMDEREDLRFLETLESLGKQDRVYWRGFTSPLESAD